jgi:hypothetical protein
MVSEMGCERRIKDEKLKIKNGISKTGNPGFAANDFSLVRGAKHGFPQFLIFHS